MNKYIVLFLIYFIGNANISKAQQVLNLSDVLTIALSNNYAIQLAKNEAELSKNNNRIGAAGMLPNVAGTALQDNQVINTQQQFLNGTENNKDGAKSSQLAANVELGWTIFDGLKMFATKSKLNELQNIGELRMRSQIEQNFTRVIRAYYDVVLAKQQTNVNKSALTISEKRVQLAQDKYDAGKASLNEVLKAKVDLNTDKSNLMKQEIKFKNSKNNLNQLLARDVSTDFDVPDSIALNAELKLTDLQTKVMAQNADVLAAKRTQQVNALAIQEINAERMPTVQLKSGYNYSKQTSEAGFLQSSQNLGFHYGAALNINLFNGFDVNKRLQNAKITLKSSELVYKDSLAKLQNNLQQSYNTYTLNNQLVQFEKENVSIVTQNFSITDEQYKVGTITSLELRDAQQNLLLSNNRYLSATYDAKLAEIELMRISGDLMAYINRSN
ncbi:MAG: TolC family protein [Bacteroidota bacterium]